MPPIVSTGFYSLFAVLLACAVADSIWYYLGRRYGNSVLRLLCRLSFESSTCVSKNRRLLPAPRLRHPALRQIHPRTFPPSLPPSRVRPACPTLDSSSTTWLAPPSGPGAYLLAGYFFGDVVQRLAPPVFAWLGHFSFVIFVLMVFGFIARRIYKQRKFLRDVRAMRLEPGD